METRPPKTSAASIAADSGHVYINDQGGTVGADCRVKEFVLTT